MKESYELLQKGDLIAIVIVLAMVVVALVRGVFAMSKDRSQARKELIENWSKAQGDKDGFLLEMIVRHGFGAYMPADLIRIISAGYLGSEALANISSEWKWFEFDSSARKIAWKTPFRNKSWVRAIERVFGFVMYFVLGMIGVMLILRNIGSIPLVVIGSAILLVAVFMLVHAFSIGEAHGAWKLIEKIDLAKKAADTKKTKGRKPKR